MHLLVLLMELENVIDAAQMSDHSNGGFAILAERFHDAVIPNAVRLVGLKGSHELRIYTTHWSLSIEIFMGKSATSPPLNSVYTNSAPRISFIPITYGRRMLWPWETPARIRVGMATSANPSVNSRRIQNLNALFGVAYREKC